MVEPKSRDLLVWIASVIHKQVWPQPMASWRC